MGEGGLAGAGRAADDDKNRFSAHHLVIAVLVTWWLIASRACWTSRREQMRKRLDFRGPELTWRGSRRQAKGGAVPPRDGDGTVEHPRVDDDGEMGPAVKPDRDLVGRDGDRGRHVDEVAKDPVGMSVGVAAHLARQEAVQTARDHQERHVEVDLDP